MLNGGMTPWDYYQGAYNNALQGNEVQMRMRQLKNQSIEQQMEYQMQMQNFALNQANAAVNNAHTTAETNMITGGGAPVVAARRLAHSMGVPDSALPPLPGQQATPGMTSAPTLSGSSPFAPSGSDSSAQTPLPPPDDSAPTQSALSNAAGPFAQQPTPPQSTPPAADTSNDSAPYPPPDSSQAAASIGSVVAAKMAQSQDPNALPSNPSQGYPSQLIAPDPNAQPLPSPSTPSPQISTSSSAAPPANTPSFMGVPYNPQNPRAVRYDPKSGMATHVITFYGPQNAEAIDLQTGEKHAGPTDFKTLGRFQTPQDAVAALPPGYDPGSVEYDPATQGWVTKGAKPPAQGAILADPQLKYISDLQNRYNTMPQVRQAQDDVSAYGQLQSAIAQHTGIGDKIASEAIQRLVNPRMAVSQAAQKGAPSGVLQWLENMPQKLSSGQTIPDEVRPYLLQIAKDSVDAGRVQVQHQIDSHVGLAHAAGIPMDIATQSFLNPYDDAQTQKPAGSSASAQANVPASQFSQAQRVAADLKAGKFDSDPAKKAQIVDKLKSYGL